LDGRRRINQREEKGSGLGRRDSRERARTIEKEDINKESTGKEKTQRGYGDSGPKEKVWTKEQQAKKKRKGDLDQRKCLSNEEQQRKRKKAEDNVDLNEHEKRISGQLLTENDLE
jgi:hypothetical protein